MNSILTLVFLLSRWERAVWSAVEIASSVGAVCELEWVHGVWEDGVNVSHDLSKRFMVKVLIAMGS